MLNEFNSIEKHLKVGRTIKCTLHHKGCDVISEARFERKATKKATMRKLRRLSKKELKNISA